MSRGAPVLLLAACEDPDLLNAGLFPRQRDLAAVVERYPIVVARRGLRFGKTRTAAAAALLTGTTAGVASAVTGQVIDALRKSKGRAAAASEEELEGATDGAT